MQSKLICSNHLSLVADNETDGFGSYFWHKELCKVEDSVRTEAGWAGGLLPQGLGHCSIACSDNQLGGAYGDQNGAQY